jgi:thymidylate synthase
MKVIYARNVNDAWLQALHLIEAVGQVEDSRNGLVRVAPWPVVTVWNNPMERVLFDPIRDANPIFHLHEALWMLAGRRDATWLDQFVSDFSSRFAEAGGEMHGAYGYRWRNHFENVNSHKGGPLDQLDLVVKELTDNPKSRQAVIQMWDAESDLGVQGLKDRPCNTQIFLRILPMNDKPALTMTVMCRSNDIVFGCYGANAVHFTILHEYLAARIGVGVGGFSQYSFNWHMYENTRHLAQWQSANGWSGYPGYDPIVTDPASIDREIRAYVEDPTGIHDFKNTFLEETALPMFWVNVFRKKKEYRNAMNWANEIEAPDWRRATIEWLERRMPSADSEKAQKRAKEEGSE